MERGSLFHRQSLPRHLHTSYLLASTFLPGRFYVIRQLAPQCFALPVRTFLPCSRTMMPKGWSKKVTVDETRPVSDTSLPFRGAPEPERITILPVSSSI